MHNNARFVSKMRICFVVFVLFVSSFTFAVGTEDCNKLGVLVYEDLGCEPIRATNDSCPIEYKCEDFARQEDTCLFQGKSYTIGEQIDDDLIYASCNVGCHCYNATEKAGFDCAILDCAEWLGAPIEEDCYRKYELGKCCSTGEACPPFDNSTKCEVDGKTYMEGQTFTPKGTCLSCVCNEGFDGNYNESFCTTNVCAVQLHHAQDLEDHCAPAYFSDDGALCCPDTWICPSSSDKIKVVNPDANSKSDLTCKYGKNELKLGEGFSKEIHKFGQDRKLKCECVVPPLLTCTQS